MTLSKKLITLFKSAICLALLSQQLYSHPTHNEIDMPLANNSKPPFKCSLNALPIQQLDNGIWVNFSLSTTQPDISKVLAWHTPLEGIWKDIFLVKANQQPALEYAGPVMKRHAPTVTDFSDISTSQALSNKVDLALVYPLQKGQRYTVALKPITIHFINQNAEQQSVQCTSNQLTIRIE